MIDKKLLRLSRCTLAIKSPRPLLVSCRSRLSIRFPSVVTPSCTYCTLRICECWWMLYETILHFYGDSKSGINWKTPQRALTFAAFWQTQNEKKETTRGTHPRIMWNFITEHFTVLKCCVPSVAELFNRRNSIKIQLRQTSELSGCEEH